MINVTNGITTGGSNAVNFNPRDSIEVVTIEVVLDSDEAGPSTQSAEAGDILAMIESAHAEHPDRAVILTGAQEVAVRRALRKVGGNLYPMPSNPTYSGRAMRPAWGNAAILCDLADAPILGDWAGTTLIAEHVAEQHRALKRSPKTADASEEADKARERSEFEKIVSTLTYLAGSADAGEAVRVAACHGLQQIGAELARR